MLCNEAQKLNEAFDTNYIPAKPSMSFENKHVNLMHNKKTLSGLIATIVSNYNCRKSLCSYTTLDYPKNYTNPVSEFHSQNK